MPEPYNHTFSGRELQDLVSMSLSHRKRLWFVYTWTRNGQTLYVGRTRSPYEHFTSHKVIGVREPLEPSDEINLQGYPTRDDALVLFGYILKRTQPVYNRVIPFRKRKSLLSPGERAFIQLHANPEIPSLRECAAPQLPNSGDGGTPETEA